MKEKFQRFMQGRYGVDQLSKALMVIAVVAILLSSFFKVNIFYIIGWVAIVYVYIRMFSRNYQKRYAENQKFLSLMKRKDYHIYKCPTCKQKIRIPRGKGKIEISCPTCHAKFIKRS